MLKKTTAILTIFLLSGLHFVDAATLDDLYLHIIQGDYDYVIDQSSAKVRSRGDFDNYYLMGLAYLKSNNFTLARDAFDNALEYAADKKSKHKILLAKGDTFLMERDYNFALNFYNKVLNDSPENGITPLVLLRCAQANIKEGNWDTGNSFIRKLHSDYSASFEARLSEAIISNNEFFCVQVGSFSRQANAYNFAQKLKSEGYQAYVIKTAADDDAVLYRVRVGECEEKIEAETLNQELINSGYETKIFP